MKCIECGKKIGALDETCPYCGVNQYDDEPARDVHVRPIVNKKEKRKGIIPIFSEEECLVYGIHPDDEMYRKTMELDILSKNYKKR